MEPEEAWVGGIRVLVPCGRQQTEEYIEEVSLVQCTLFGQNIPWQAACKTSIHADKPLERSLGSDGAKAIRRALYDGVRVLTLLGNSRCAQCPNSLSV